MCATTNKIGTVLFTKRLSLLLFVLLFSITLVSCDDRDMHDYDHSQEVEADLMAGEEQRREGIEEYDLTIASYQTFYEEFVDEELLNAFEQKYGYKIKTIIYNESQYDALNTKLLAKDTDIDIFYTSSLPLHTYVSSGYYVDLGEYESLRSRFESSVYASHVGGYNGKYFGVPCSVPNLPVDAWTAIVAYEIRHIDLIESTYSDPDGEELFELLKYRYYAEDASEEGASGFYADEYYSIGSEYFIMSPYSERKDVAVLFLETVFDKMNSGEEPQVNIRDDGTETTRIRSYPDIESLNGVRLWWTFSDNANITKPLTKAMTAAKESDGSDEALRKLAKDAAREVRQRLEG